MSIETSKAESRQSWGRFLCRHGNEAQEVGVIYYLPGGKNAHSVFKETYTCMLAHTHTHRYKYTHTFAWDMHMHIHVQLKSLNTN